MIRRLVVAGTLLGCVAAAAFTGPVGAAQTLDSDRQVVAARATKSTVTNSYSAYRMAWVDKFDLCLGVYVTAKIRATKVTEPVEGGTWVRITDPRVVDPSMLVTTKKSCDDNAEVKKYHRGNTVRYNSYYYGHSCSYNPSFNVGYPWSVGVGITPDCGEKKVARLGDTQKNARRAYRFTLATDGRAFSWKASDSDTIPTSLKLCTSVSAYFVLRDTEGAVRDKAMRKVGLPDACVRYKYPS